MKRRAMRKKIKILFLSEFKNESFVIQQKAYVLLWLLLIIIPVMLIVIIINHFNLHGPIYIKFSIINFSFIFFIFIGLALLRNGKYNSAVAIVTGIMTILAILACVSNGFTFQNENIPNIILVFVVIVFSGLFGSRLLTTIISFFFFLVIAVLSICTILLNPAYYPGSKNFEYILGLGINSTITIIFIFIFSFLVSRITEIALNRTEEELEKNKELNLSLELKVKKRTEALEAAKKISDQDMYMATNVQSSLFPKDPPDSSEWDIAFTFQPMSGVSGDLYDFYEKDGRLLGLTLCDVSGHGIASGLITMIARTVIHRNFVQGKNNPLNCILEKTNKELISEIGKLDNYLTGILLRFEENNVEYVNAGHPSMLLKKGSSGAVENLDAGKHNFKGSLLGLQEFQLPFGVISYKMDSNDLLLLFSDGLTEGINEKNELFGKYLSKLLSQAPAGSSEDTLKFVLQGFNDFMKNTEFQDDITVLVVRKR
ncbi:MAG: serine/threonine-protein phosphatase [bacterium]|nr:serine/threonine-protein phosphatase [bacterium]